VGDGLGRAEAARLAASWFERAAAAAMGVAAHEAARTLLRQALDLTTDDDLLGKAHRWQRFGDATAYVADMDEGATAYEAAADLFHQVLEDPERGSEDRTAARTGLANAVTALGLVRIQQLRFTEAVALAEAALDTIGPAEDLETAWLLYLRAWGTEAFSRRPETKTDMERALTLALALGDRRLELELGMHLVSMAADEGAMSFVDMGASDLAAARTAAELGDWPQVCKRLRHRALILLEEDRNTSVAALDEAAMIAEAHGLTEDVAWADYGRVEDGLMYGDWDSALEAGIRALDLADRNAYHRVQVRTWFALSPIAAARGMRDLLQRAAAWFDEHQAIFPHSPFGNVMHGGVDHRLARAGLIAPVDIEPRDVLPAWDESQGLPSWHAAVEAIVDGWLTTRRHDAVRDVLARIATWREHPTTEALGRGSEALMTARLLLDQGDRSGAGSAARLVLRESRACRASWWIARGIRLLDAMDEATVQEIEEARSIERSLGLAGVAR
jgi:tetratricopeptide (TPR) repeat protein